MTGRDEDGNLDRNPDIMSDITKCTNDKCIIRKGCYRWTAPANPLWQSYSRFEPYHTGDYYTCDHYIPDHKIPVHTNHPFTAREQDPIVNAIPSKSRELE